MNQNIYELTEIDGMNYYFFLSALLMQSYCQKVKIWTIIQPSG